MQDKDFGVLVGQAYAGFVHDLHRALALSGHTDLHGWTGYVLRALQAQPLNLRDLAQRLGMTSQGAIKIVDALVQDGYLVRAPDSTDGRVRRIEVTPRGRDLLACAKRFHADYAQRMAERFGTESVQGLQHMLAHMASSLPDEGGERALRPV